MENVGWAWFVRTTLALCKAQHVQEPMSQADRTYSLIARARATVAMTHQLTDEMAEQVLQLRVTQLQTKFILQRTKKARPPPELHHAAE